MRKYHPIKDYAAIGDCRSIGLISKEGSLDWLCWPRFDSPSVFGALLDRDRGGQFRVSPRERFTSSRRYLKDTNVLETTFRTDTGTLRLSDCMPMAGARENAAEVMPEHEVLRLAECVDGRVEVEILCDPRPGYGSSIPKPLDRGRTGFQFDLGVDLYTLRSTIALSPSAESPGVRGRCVLTQGQSLCCTLSSAHGSPAVIPALDDAAWTRLAATVAWWENWIGHCPYDGPFREAVLRSMLALKMLIFSPSGAVIAAGTTSLPEQAGGALNWDYRFCWLRDSAMTLRALLGLGYRSEGEAFFSWLVHATRLTQPELQVVYDVYGETRLEERTLDGLEGYNGALPVRVGNAAREQLQLDVYGEVMRAASEYVRHEGRLDRTMQRMLRGIGRVVARRWQEPDNGIWEIRGEPRHHTFSKAMCWIALDRLLSLYAEGHIEMRYKNVRELTQMRDEIRTAIEANGYSSATGSYVSVFGGETIDASLLVLALYGYVDPSAPRMLETHQRIVRLLSRNGLLYRYGADFAGQPDLREAAFGICSFWQVSYLARCGRTAEATDLFAHILTFANDVGLFAEEIQPDTGEAVGNYPQAFTHVGLIDAALSLQEAAEERKAA